MNPNELVFRGTDEVVAVACGKCGTVYSTKMSAERAIMMATDCCDPHCSECRAPCRRGWTFCDACRDKKRVELESARFAKAKKIALGQWSDPYLFVDGAPDEGFVEVSGLGDTLAEMRANGVTVPTYAWTTEEHRANFNLVDALHNMLADEQHESAPDFVDDALIGAAQVIVNRALADVVSYTEKHDIAVLLPIAEACAMCGRLFLEHEDDDVTGDIADASCGGFECDVDHDATGTPCPLAKASP